MKLLLAALTVYFSVYSSFSLSRDLGEIGSSYEIKENDLIEVIISKLGLMKKSGELDKLHETLVDESKSYASRPKGVVLPRAVEYKAIEVSVVYVLDKDIFDSEGKLLFKKGTTVNPLDIKPLSKTLCFVDGDDPLQVEWLKKYCMDNIRNKLILTNGDYLKVSNELDRRMYFDQRGQLVEKFNIQALPAVVRQSGRVLYAEEFPVN